MARAEAIRSEIQRLVNARPFHRFLITLESGDRVLIEHPENISFDPGGRREDFSVITGRVHLVSTFDAVSSVAVADRAGTAA